jgi:hypothetical protein
MIERRRAIPLTDAQVRRVHRWRFGVAVAAFAYTLLLLAIASGVAIENGIDVPVMLALIGIGALGVYLWRVILRRWHRLS